VTETNWRQCGILWPKEICFSEHRATNVGLLYPKVHKNFGGDIPIDVPTNQNIGGDVSPASPAALTPVQVGHWFTKDPKFPAMFSAFAWRTVPNRK